MIVPERLGPPGCSNHLVNSLELGLGFRVWGLGFRVWGLGFGVYGLGPNSETRNSKARNPKVTKYRPSFFAQTLLFWVV